MNHADIVKLPLICDSLYAYILDESLLIYSQKTQNVYGFEKGSAALFFQIDELVRSHSSEEIAKQFPNVDATLLKQMSDLVGCKEAADAIEYEVDMDLGTYTKDDLPRTYYQEVLNRCESFIVRE